MRGDSFIFSLLYYLYSYATLAACNMEDEALKKQFQQLQDQQQKKLQRRKEKKTAKSKESTSLSMQTNKSFGIDDDLCLKVSDTV